MLVMTREDRQWCDQALTVTMPTGRAGWRLQVSASGHFRYSLKSN